MNFFDGLKEYESMKPGLSRIKKFLKAAGNPQDKIKCVHIAGTNGKGSAAAFLSSALKENGYETALYTSPHLIDITERIKINGKNITKATFAAISKKHAALAKKCKLTYFEYITAIAFIYFASQKVDIAVIETGLGGRFDATNAIKNPLVSIITSIGLDHKEILGNTISKIAFEKAGIIKNNCPVICADLPPAALKIIRRKSKPYILGKDFNAAAPASCHSGLDPESRFLRQDCGSGAAMTVTAPALCHSGLDPQSLLLRQDCGIPYSNLTGQAPAAMTVSAPVLCHSGLDPESILPLSSSGKSKDNVDTGFRRYDNTKLAIQSFDYVGIGCHPARSRRVYKFIDSATLRRMTTNQNLKDVQISLLGNHQIKNAALALCALEVLSDIGYNFNAHKIKKALLKTKWPARLDLRKLPNNAEVLIDGAHNKQAIEALVSFLSGWLQGRKAVFIFAVMKEKEHKKIITALIPFAKKIILPRIINQRAVSPELLEEEILKISNKVEIVKNISVKEALNTLKPGEKNVSAGSLYLAGEILRQVKSKM